MLENQVSSTAMLVNQLRAEHQAAAFGPRILVDPVAVAFGKQFEGASPLAAYRTLSKPSLDMLQSTLVLRSRWTEEVLCEVAGQEYCQYALLGAGFDTFAYRQPAWAHEISIFEIDHPMTQAAKRQVLKSAGYSIPTNVHFCQIDFQQMSLHNALAATPFRFDVPTVFSWLGVTQYITHAAFRATLEFVLSLPSPSTIVFSFIATDDVLSEVDRQMGVNIERPVAASGEPWISRYTPDDLQQSLRDMGFSTVDYLCPEIAQARYFRNRHDELRAPRVEQLMRATI